MGTRVTGWCAATRRVSANANASLDLANLADFFDPPLRSVLCTPLIEAEQVIGVLTAYSHKLDAFTDKDVYAFEQIGDALTDRLRKVFVVDPSRPLLFRPRLR